MATHVTRSQDNFLRNGGIYQFALADMYEKGIFPEEHVYREYPKMLRFSKGVHPVPKSTMTCDKEKITWTENVELFEEIIVYDEAEHERILAGGKTSAQMEEDRQVLIRKCATAGINVDPSWTAVRLRRELGEKMDEPEPKDEMAALQAQLERLEALAAMKKRIAELEMEVAAAPSDEVEDMRGQLSALGITVDKRWGAARLRDELEAATAPKVA